MEDRKRIKDVDIRREKELKVQKDADERLLEARKLAGMGFSVEEIEEELKRIKMVSAVLSHASDIGFPSPALCLRSRPAGLQAL